MQALRPLFLLTLLPASLAAAANLQVQVTDAAGQPLQDAAVYAEPVGGQPPRHTKVVEIEQKGRKFMPLLTVVQTGTEISFPNHDTVRHHVYSLSPAKPFELKLYSGVPGKPILFDKPGTVVLGCNIHDQMVAYIRIVDTPWFAKTDGAGKATIDNLPPGRYQLKAWHVGGAPNAQPVEQPLTMTAGDASASMRLPGKS